MFQLVLNPLRAISSVMANVLTSNAFWMVREVFDDSRELKGCNRWKKMRSLLALHSQIKLFAACFRLDPSDETIRRLDALSI